MPTYNSLEEFGSPFKFVVLFLFGLESGKTDIAALHLLTSDSFNAMV